MNKIISEKKLNRIFNHYKKQYNLNTELDILQEGLTCKYHTGTDYIFFGIAYIIFSKEGLQKRSKKKSDYNNILFSLLHEIRHAIDKDILEYEFKSIDLLEYQNNNEYHHSRPFEIRADNFARQELKRWV